MQVPYIPNDAPFNADQRQWLSGFLAGLHSRLLVQSEQAGGGAVAAAEVKRVGILFGTQTGNSEGVAREAAAIAKASGLTPQVLDMADVQVDQLQSLERVLIVCSTYGEGEMPDNAHEFWDALSADSAPALKELPYAVLALGDTNYDLFCEAGRLLDDRLAELGADRVVARLDCDVDYEKPARQWMEELMPVLAGKGASTGGAAALPSVADDGATAKKWSRTNPYQATLKRKGYLE